MAITQAQAFYGLTAQGTASRTQVSGIVSVGPTMQTARLPTVNEGYSVRAILVGDSQFVLTLATGATTGTTEFVTGVAQIETATIVAASGCTSNGDMTLVVTSAGMAGTPKNVVVPLTTAAHTTAALIAAAARTALATDSAVNGRFEIGGTGADITLTRRGTTVSDLTLYYANDATLNLAIPAGLGVTAAATSADPTAGVATSGVKLYDAGVNFEGKSIETIATIAALMIQNTGDEDASVADGDFAAEIWAGETTLRVNPDGLQHSALTFDTGSAAAKWEITVTVFGATA